MTQPMYWINPKNGNQYNLAVQTPDYRINSLAALENTPVQAPGHGQAHVPAQAGNRAGNIATGGTPPKIN